MADAALLDRHEAREIDRITQIKLDLGKRLIILGHYYQRLPVVLLSDCLGDSFGLSSRASRTKESRYIVFCGVEFMAESAEILRTPEQRVFHPSALAGCPMSDMADFVAVEKAHHLASETLKKKVVPVAYMNTSAEVKAFCGRNGGIICTSSNAEKAFQWAYDRGEAILFIPDEHLGTNTANRLNIPLEARSVFNPLRESDENSALMSRDTRLILWKGYCHVHTWFTTEQVREVREQFPDAKIIVHPECPEEVVALADHSGSTAFMHRFIAEEAAEGSTTIVGTEINMVEFLRHQYGENKTILPLSRSFCPNMYRINLKNLRETLESLEEDRFQVSVPQDIKKDARIALNRMLELA
ncbi:MAG: quinolinate synthase NadA [Planctomycetota bacterium]|jgi:quinolinate synthase